MTYIVTGGAGYLGSHLVDLLIKSGEHEVVVIDDLSTGNHNRLPSGVRLINTPLESQSLLKEVENLDGIRGLFHLAARKSVSESLLNPSIYEKVNVDGTANVIEFCQALGIRNLVFTSSAAVYGSGHNQVPISESSDCLPENPYGETKLLAERLVNEFSNYEDVATISLRVFNMAGASKPNFFDRKGENVIPIILRSIADGNLFTVFGSKLNTLDGTCVRDYIHVNDVARAHLLAMQKIEISGEGSPKVLNISSGQGTSVLELVHNLELITSKQIPIKFEPLRHGDSESVIGNCNEAKVVLGWKPQKTINEMLSDSWISWNSL